MTHPYRLVTRDLKGIPERDTIDTSAKLCRVLQQSPKKLGKLFAECDSRQIDFGELYIVNEFFSRVLFIEHLADFVEYHLTLGKEKSSLLRQVIVTEPMSCVLSDTRQKGPFFCQVSAGLALDKEDSSGPFPSCRVTAGLMLGKGSTSGPFC